MAPLVSVVMPCFNAGPMLRPALQSVIGQSHPNLEIVFVDNNSTDGSLALAEAIAAASPRPFKLLRCAAQGANHARNLGYGDVAGDYVQWMDADDLMDPDKIAVQLAALEHRDAFDLAYCDWSERRLAPGAKPLVRRHALEQVDDQILRTLAAIWYPQHAYLLRRRAADLLQERQGWWPERGVTDDVEYSALAALIGLRFLHVPGAHVHYNVWSTAQLSGSISYPQRAAAHRDMFARLQREAAALGPGLRLSAQHKLLLEQSWDVWGPPRTLVLGKLPGRRFRLERRDTGRSIELRPREAQVVTALQGRTHALTLCHHALQVAGKAPDLARDHVAILTTLQRLAREGFLDLAHKIDAPAAPAGPD